MTNKEFGFFVMDTAIKHERFADFLSGKNGTKLLVPNGSELNLQPQDYVGVVNLTYEAFTTGRHPNINRIFEAALLQNANGDLTELYAAINIVLYQLAREKKQTATFSLEDPKQILENIRSNIIRSKTLIDQERKLASLSGENGYWAEIESANRWLGENNYTEIAPRQMK